MLNSSKIVHKALVEIGVQEDEISPNASLNDDLAVDSTEMIELITVMERQLAMSLDEKELKSVKTVEELVSFIETKAIRQPNKIREHDNCMKHTEHCITVNAPVHIVYTVLEHIEGYADLFPPTQSSIILEQGEDYQIARLVVDVSGQIQSWTTRRDLDKVHNIIHYQQIQTAPLMESIGGEWRCFSLRETQTQLVLTHDFQVRKPINGLIAGMYSPEQAEKIVCEAVERNSVADLQAVKQESERRFS